jgi:hypothetical protein
MPRAKKGYDEPLIVGNHTVQVIEVAGAQRLLVDGVRRPYIEAPNGFTVREAIYDEPAKTLLDAGKRLAERLEARDAAAAARGD